MDTMMDIAIIAAFLAFAGVLAVLVTVLMRKKGGADPDTTLISERLRQAEEDKQKLQADNRILAEKYDSEKETRIRAEAKVSEQQKIIEDWDKQKQQFMDAISASIKAENRKNALEISDKLLSRHKAESQASQETQRKNLNDITKDLQQHFEKLVKQVDNFGGRLQNQEKAVDILDRMLTEPRKMGEAAEVILENTLKSMGLTEPQDFLLQSSFDTAGGKLRPDAVIFLPDDNIIIIDSKSSSILKELIIAEAGEKDGNRVDEAILNKKLKSAMRKHLQDLSGKEYISAVKKGITPPHRPHFSPQQIFTLLWVPTDGILERIRKADEEFIFVASDKNIHVAGPSALQAVIAVAAAKISIDRQNQNQAIIVQETETLLQSMTTALNHAIKIGKAIRTVDTAYDKFAGSVNRTLLPKARRLVEWGIAKPQGNFGASLPRHRDIPDYEAPDEAEEEMEEAEKPVLTAPPDRPDE